MQASVARSRHRIKMIVISRPSALGHLSRLAVPHLGHNVLGNVTGESGWASGEVAGEEHRGGR